MLLSFGRTLQLRFDAIGKHVHYPRFAEASLLATLADTPVVLVHGPRQCGKTTLAQRVGRRRGSSSRR